MTTADKSLKDKAMDIKGKDYVQVKDRIQYLSDNYDGRYSLESDYQYYPENRLWVVKSTLTIWDEKHEHCCVYTGLAQEVESDDFKKVNFTSALENAQTSARGRCCAGFGLGIQCDGGIASADEMNKALNRQKAAKAEPKSDTKSNPQGRFQKAISNKKFMLECRDEEDFIGKIKGKYEIDEIVESQLRDAYKSATTTSASDLDLPFN